jgi:hypothetical protein
LLLFLVITVDSVKSSKLEISEEKENSQLIDAVDVMIRKMVKYNFQTVNFISALNESADLRMSAVKSEILRRNQISYGIKVSNFMKIKDESPLRKRYSVFLLDSIENFRKLNAEINHKKFQFRGVFILVLVNGYIQELDQVFDAMWSRSISNIYSLYETESGEINLSTVDPFQDASSCGDTRAKVINQFINGTFTKEINFFGDKFAQLNNCSVRVTTFEDKTTTHITDFADGSFKIDGPYIDLLRVISQQLNFSVNFNVLREPSPWGLIYKNETMTGALKLLHEKKTDISLGFYYLRLNRINHFDRSSILFATPLVLVVPPGRRFTSLEKLLQPFNRTVWVLLVVMFITGIFIMLLLHLKFKSHKSLVYGQKVNYPGLNMMAAILGLSQSVLPRRNFPRILLMMFLLFCLVMRNTYQGLLYKFIQSNNRHKEVQSFTEMIHQNFTFYTYESELDLIENFKVLTGRIQFFEDENFLFHRALHEDERVGVIDGLIDILVMNEKNKLKFRHKMYRQRLITTSMVFYMRRNFFLSTAINNKIDVILSSGLMVHWVEESIKYDEITARRHETKKKEPKVMNVDELMGPFIILIVGHSAALVVLLFEIVIHKIRSLMIVL